MLLAASCSEKPSSPDQPTGKQANKLDFASLVASQTGGARDLASFLESGEEAEAIDVIDGANDIIDSVALSNSNDKFSGQGNENEEQGMAIRTASFPNSTIESHGRDFQANFEISLDELKISNERKDKTIASLTRLNEELILEIQRLRPDKKPIAVVGNQDVQSLSSDNQLKILQSEIALLKSNLIQKSQEIDGLRLQNDQFQNGIDSLQPRVNPSPYNRSSIPARSSQTFNSPVGLTSSQAPQILENSETCNLEFDAVVTLLNGKSKEVFYTEFFLISKSFPDLLFDAGLFLKDFPQVSSFEELWAQSRKSPFLFPGIYKRIRNVLLREVEQGNGHRVRTDIDGFAEFNNLSSGSFFLVGTAPVGKTGAVWNVPVLLRSGTNKTSLTLANANWRE
ncbi:MAG: hypothetical protein VW576_04855 [Opitutae bacterium]